MATVIRLQRGGRTHAADDRVVGMDSRNRTRGAVGDQIGTYHPGGGAERATEIEAEKAVAG